MELKPILDPAEFSAQVTMPPIIEFIHSQMETQLEGDVLRACMKVGVEVDKPRLVQALTDARAFWWEGYEAGRKESLRPKGKWINAKVRVPNEEERDCAIVGIVNGNNGRINFDNGLIFVCYDADCDAWWSNDYDIERCSVDYWFAIPNFCPNCGADTRGETHDS